MFSLHARTLHLPLYKALLLCCCLYGQGRRRDKEEGGDVCSCCAPHLFFNPSPCTLPPLSVLPSLASAFSPPAYMPPLCCISSAGPRFSPYRLLACALTSTTFATIFTCTTTVAAHLNLLPSPSRDSPLPHHAAAHLTRRAATLLRCLFNRHALCHYLFAYHPSTRYNDSSQAGVTTF